MEKLTIQAPASDTTPAPSVLITDSESKAERVWKLIAKRLGRRYASASFDTYAIEHDAQRTAVEKLREYAGNLRENIGSGKSVFLFGPPGTGKDHLLIPMLKAAVKENLLVRWDDGAEMFGAFRDSMKGTDTEAKLLARYTSPMVLAISDPVPPFGGLTPYQSSMFFRIIDRRYRDMIPTWITINCKDRKEAEDRMGASIVDRLGHNALAISFNWQSYRAKR